MNNNYENMKCIWMASQVVDYKLCDNQFECESCMFDKVIRNLVNKKEKQFGEILNAADVILNNLNSIGYDERIVYLKNNLVAKEICYNTFYLGINPILNCFLDSVSSIEVCERGRKITNGEDVIHISGSWGAVNLSAPIDFLIYDKGGDQTENQLKSQWLAIIGIENHQLDKGQLSKAEWTDLHKRALAIINEIKLSFPKVGDTMMDGGTHLKFLHQLVGNKKYINILNSLSE